MPSLELPAPSTRFQPTVLLKRSAHSVGHASFFYPIKGLYYFVAHPWLYPLLRARFLPIALLSLFILTNLFVFAYLPQVAFLALFHGKAGAFINGAILVLGEGAAIVGLLFEAFFVDETMVDVFDAVLLKEGLEDLIATSRIIHPDGENPVKKLGKPTTSAVYSPFSLRQIVEFVVLLPLNFIPIAGIPLFLLLTGYRAGPFHHWRYFKLLGFSKKERKAFVKARQGRYTGFGTIALMLQLVPVLQMFFLLTTAAGSALWVVELEQRRRALEDERTRPLSRDDSHYRDDPS